MSETLSSLEAGLVGKKLRRLEAAKAELAKPTTQPLLLLLSVMVPLLVVVPFSERIAHYLGIPVQLLFPFIALLSALVVSSLQVASLQRKVGALTVVTSSLQPASDA